MGDFREHGVMLYLDKPEYLGFIKCQADKGLGRSYAGKLIFTEGEYRLGYLSKEDYEARKKKYSQGLNEEKTLSKEQLEALAQERKIENVLKGVLDQWESLPRNAREYHLQNARKFSNLPIAKLILEKGAKTENGNSNSC